MRTKHSPAKRIKSDDRLLDIIEKIRDLDGATLEELDSELDAAKSTIHNHLSTLRNRGYIVKQDEKYQLGIFFLDLGVKAQNKVRGFTDVKSKIDWLAEETGERAQFMVEEHGLGYNTYAAQGGQAVRAAPDLGWPQRLHVTAAGKSILAHKSEREIDSIIDHWGLPAQTNNTITDREELIDELDRIRDGHLAINEEESDHRFGAIGSPVLEEDDTIIGSISISGPVHRVLDEKEQLISDKLLGAVNEIEVNLNPSRR